MKRILVIIIFFVVFTWVLFPVFWILITSIKATTDAFSVPPVWFFTPTFEHYKVLFGIGEFKRSFLNSTIIAIFSTAIVVTLATPAGYVYSRFDFPGKRSSAFFLLAARMFPPVVIVPSLFGITRFLDLYDTHLLIILLYASFTISFAVWMMKAFFDEISPELEEAAMVDGHTRIKAFIKVALPLASPGLVATSIFTFILSWNEFLFAFMFSSNRAKTAPVELVGIVLKETGTEWGLMSAGSSLLIIPAAIFSILVQKHLIKGLTAGSVKG